MRYLSVCSGIEAATVAWHPLGWQPAAFAEIEPFPSAVLAHHWPDVPNLGDMTAHHDWPDRIGPIQLLVGGTPCQAFSVAGLRQGLADPRGNLTLTFLAIVAQHKPTWVVWENVPGVLSDKTGAFGSLLGGLAELGYGWAYRVLDAQYFGLAQRRKRVFVVGCLGGWAAAAAVLFERESLRGHPAPRRREGKIAPTIPSRSLGGGGLGTDFDLDGGLVTHALRGEGFDASEDGTGRGTPIVPVLSPTLRAGGNRTGGDRTPGTDVDTCESLIPIAFGVTTAGPIETAPALNANRGCHNPGDFEAGTLLVQPTPIAASAHPPAIAFPERLSSTQCVSTEELSPALQSANPTAVAFSGRARGDDGRGYDRPPQVFGDGPVGALDTVKPHCVAFQPRIARNGRGDMGDVVNALQAQSGGTGKGDAAPCVATSQSGKSTSVHAVRRLTPRECERLQGFPDDHTRIPSWKGWRKLDEGETIESCRGEGMEIRITKKSGIVWVNDPDGPRYKAIGNSMAVPVMAWIGRRIAHIDTLLRPSA